MMLAFFLLISPLTTPQALGVHGSVYSVEVVVVCLQDVSSHGVGDMSRMVEGVRRAGETNRIRYNTGEFNMTLPWYPEIYREIPLNVTVTVIRDWDAYQNLVQSSHGTIIINVHGETLPIPSNYHKEEWVEEVAEAMAHRNVTWAHTAGYPLYHYHHQDSGEAVWGETGFKQLMSHIGKPNITCWPPGEETVKIDITSNA
ncbi:hypothetical protein GWM83_02490, partial [Candidatus Bathyarchaeota archaeon]|nr:hypothetical protein [Candidatus Bathyarchaeota archaeon]NIV68182.1 hypothetical protein [Candidatus Bathyarchaeota archaeon]NIW34414.1 hypothetical protein [Candidatus Bathyarchaeota archaeon]